MYTRPMAVAYETESPHAIRKAMTLAVSHVPTIAQAIGPAELAAKALESSIDLAHGQVQEELKVLDQVNSPKRLVSLGDGYADTRTTPATPAQIELGREPGDEDE